MKPTSIQETAGGALFPQAIDLEKIKAAHKPLVTERIVVDYDGNTAAATACCQMWRSVMFAGFPITPSTKWLETVTTLVNGPQKGSKFMKLMEAEHAVADYMAGAGAACRDLIVSTATSSVGLDHMTESTRSLGASGLGNLLLVNVYRATANYPLCIEGDPSDAFAHRDDGWIQICCRGVQQIYDTILQAPCLGMHPEILTPVMPGYYGIKDSHRSSRLVMEPDSAINAFQDRWILPAQLPGLINGDTAMGNCVTSKHFQGFKIDQRTRMERALDMLPIIGADFEKTFGRPGLEFFEKILWPEGDDVDVAIVGMGPDIGTAAAVAATESEKLNVSIGVLGARLLTPFPYAAYAAQLAKAKIVLVLNQAHHYGPGHLGLDIAQACYALEPRPSIVNCFAGLGGASVSDETWRQMIRHACRSAADGERMERPILLHEGAVLWPS
jgi:pyruvate ferredoxin oxidoreductase alpha subunit